MSTSVYAYSVDGVNLSKCIVVTINNSLNPSNLYNYTVFVNISKSSHMLSDYSDIRFVNETCGQSGTLLGHWKRNSSQNWAYEAVMINDSTGIPANGYRNISVYYGNESEVSDASDIGSAFLFGDDFSNLDINTDKWLNTIGSVVNGTWVLDTGGVSGLTAISKYVLPENYMFVARTKLHQYTVVDAGIIKELSGDLDESSLLYRWYWGPQVIGMYVNGIESFTTPHTFTDDSWYEMILNRSGGIDLTGCFYDNEPICFTDNTSSVRGNATLAVWQGKFTIDWIFVRNYSLIEPTTNFNFELVEGAPINSITLLNPSNGKVVGNHNISFEFVPLINGVRNCSLYINSTGIWSLNNTNSTPVINASQNSLNLNLSNGYYVWNIGCYNDSDELFGNSNMTLTVITDENPPTYSFNSSSSFILGSPCTLELTFDDNVDLQDGGGYIFSTNNSGEWVNSSWSAFYTTPQQVSVPITLNSSLGSTVYWCFYANDSSENWNGTSCNDPFMIHTKTTPSFSSSASESITYGTSSDYTTSEDNSLDEDCSYSLLRDSAEIGSGSSVSDDTVLGAGEYNYTYYTDGCENYIAGKDEIILTVEQANRGCILNTDKLWERTYDETPSNTSCSVSAGEDDGYMDFYVNDYYYPDNPDQKADAGIYEYYCSWNGGDNYSDCEETNILTINIANPICTLESSIGWNYIYGNATTLTCSCSFDGETNLYVDGILRNDYNNSEIIFAASSGYDIVCNVTEGSNYNSGQSSETLIVDKANIQVNLYLNGTLNDNVTYTYPQSVNATGASSVLTPSIYRDDVSKSNPELIQLANATYAYKVNATGNANYSDNVTGLTYYAIVNRVTPSCTLTSTEGWDYNYGTSTILTCGCSGDGTAHLYFGDVLHDDYNNTGTVFGGTTGTSLVCNITTGTNYSSATASNTLIVNPIAPMISVAPLTAVTYGTSTQTGCQRTTGDSGSLLTLYRNGTSVASGTSSPQNETSVVLGAAVYNYTCTISVTQNYTADTSLNNHLTVNKATLSLTISSGTTQTYPYQSTVTGSETNNGDNDVTYQLWRDTTNVANPETNYLGVGSYTYRYNASVGANWTANSTGVTTGVTITQNSSTSSYMNLTINGTDGNKTYTYPAVSNATGYFSGFYGNAPTFTLYRYFNTSIGSSNPQSDLIRFANETHWYVYNTSGNMNYSSASKSYFIFINKAASTVAITLTNNNTTYGNNQTAWCNITSGDQVATITLLRNGTSVASGFGNQSESTVLGASTYNYSCTYAQSQNYTSGSAQSTMTVNKENSTCSLTGLTDHTYGLTDNAVCVCSNGLESHLFMNGVQRDSFNNTNTVYDVGTYDWICNGTNNNYTITPASVSQIITAARASQFGGGTGPSTTCTYDWKCSDWSACQNSVQKRTCTNAGTCKDSKSKPDETQLCKNSAAPVVSNPSPTANSTNTSQIESTQAPTATATSSPATTTPLGLGVGVIAVIAISAILSVIILRKKAHKKKVLK
ncbi:MAG: DUF2341 domain-containing protein [Candidatus Aenigmatarchaeota archaeon]